MTVLTAGTPAFNTFYLKYSDVCDAIGIGAGIDIDDNLSVFANDEVGAYVGGGYANFDTLQFFVPKGAVQTDEKSETKESVPITAIPVECKTGPYDVAEITMLVNFIESTKYSHQLALSKHLTMKGYDKYVTDHGGILRTDMTSYQRVYVDSVLATYVSIYPY